MKTYEEQANEHLMNAYDLEEKFGPQTLAIQTQVARAQVCATLHVAKQLQHVIDANYQAAH